VRHRRGIWNFTSNISLCLFCKSLCLRQRAGCAHPCILPARRHREASLLLYTVPPAGGGPPLAGGGYRLVEGYPPTRVWGQPTPNRAPKPSCQYGICLGIHHGFFKPMGASLLLYSTPTPLSYSTASDRTVRPGWPCGTWGTAGARQAAGRSLSPRACQANDSQRRPWRWTLLCR
jgi:hypothetical protein